MTDRPIIFSAPMIRALLDGSKTQTRRVLKLGGRQPDYIGPRGCTADPACWGWDDGKGGYILADRDPDDLVAATWQDYAAAWRAGDRAWVREAHALVPYTAYAHSEGVEVTAHGGTYEAAIYRQGFDRSHGGIRWRPSIHMPRWASRITLAVTDVRVQRLQDISEDDAVAEGCRPFFDHDNPTEHVGPNGTVHQMAPLRGPLDDFHRLWNSLHGNEAWDANPWVCTLTFTVQRGNIDGCAA